MDVTRMIICPENTTSNQIWMNYDISTCALEIISTMVVVSYTLIFGIHQFWKHGRCKADTDCDRQKKNDLHWLQLFLLCLMPMFSLINIILQAKHIYGYMIISTISSLIIYPYLAFTLRMKRYEILPNKSDGYGNALFGFWILSFVMENIMFVHSSNQVFSFKWLAMFDKFKTILPYVRYLNSLLIFSFALLAPSILRVVSEDSKVKDECENKSKLHEILLTTRASYKNTWDRFKVFAFFLWPKEDRSLQLNVLACLVLIFIGNLFNILIPLYDQKIIDSVSESQRQFRWELVTICAGFEILREVMRNLRSFLWQRFEQYTYSKVEVEIYWHLLSLSLRWHLKRNTGEVSRIVDRGTSAIHYLVYRILFKILPLTMDTAIAIVFFISIFDKWIGLIVFTSTVFYLVTSIGITEWHIKIEERRKERENNQTFDSSDSLLNFETVKSHAAESYEVQSFKQAILDSHEIQRQFDVTWYILYTLQSTIDNFGFLAAPLVSLYMIVHNQELTVGHYYLFINYYYKLQGPLNQLAFTYRDIQKALIYIKSLFDLLEEKQEIADLPDAKPLKIKDGRIQFSNVSFSYTPEKPILKNVNFVVPPGKTIALVGPSGAGKSTIMRLLFRFFDVNEGSILIDGQYIRTVKQESLRKAIGVVPQDIMLFNRTIKYNIKYGNVNASDEEVIEAAKHADIHDRILTFSDGYETKVGERGLRLSGGEKQRVAIARTILKDPKIVLLDEATSSLDIQSERKIQAALNRVCVNRSTVIIAHRLSTIIHADEILVLKEGEIIERGKHKELLLQRGVYHDMWEAQFKKEEENVEEKPPEDAFE